MTKQLILFCTIFILFYGLINVESQVYQGNCTYGQMGTKDVLLHAKMYNFTGVPGKIKTQNITIYTQSKITCIHTIDLYINKTKSIIYLVNGGLGVKNVTFLMHSTQPGNSYGFWIGLYGRRVFRFWGF